MTVAELEQRMSSRELIEWQAFAEVEPFGELRADLRIGIQTAALVRLWADPKKSKAITPATFMPQFEQAAQPAPEPKTPEQLLARFDALTAGMTGG